MQKKIAGRIVIAVAALAGLAIVFFLGKWIGANVYHVPDVEIEQTPPVVQAEPGRTEEELEELYNTIKVTALSGQSGFDNASAESAPAYQSEVDFEYLWTVNQDIIAWISVPGTNIDYPVLQHPTDDSYYLNHNIDGSTGYPGCIYIEGRNAADFTDPNTVLYGHNLKAKTMFTELHKFADRDFFEENDEVIIYLPDRKLHYRIFAALVYDDRHLLYSFDFSDEDIFDGFLQSIYDIRDMSANINRDFTVTSQDRILTMETCMPGTANRDNRRLVMAVLTEE